MTIARTLRSSLTTSEKAGGGLLELWLEVGPACHLHCGFCFNGNGESRIAFGLLSPAEHLDILQQFRALGGVSLGIPGNGEPFHSGNCETTMFIAREAARLGLRTNIFTSGDLLTEELANELHSFGVSLSLKWNSFRPAVQDRLGSSAI